MKHIGEKLLSCRSEGKIEEEVVYRAAIEMIRSIEMNKVERIMIDMANSAE